MGIILNPQVSYSIRITSELSGLYLFYCLLIVMYECYTTEFIAYSLYTEDVHQQEFSQCQLFSLSFSRMDVKTSAEELFNKTLTN